jgi:hypothetical protein
MKPSIHRSAGARNGWDGEPVRPAQLRQVKQGQPGSGVGWRTAKEIAGHDRMPGQSCGSEAMGVAPGRLSVVSGPEQVRSPISASALSPAIGGPRRIGVALDVVTGAPTSGRDR